MLTRSETIYIDGERFERIERPYQSPEGKEVNCVPGCARATRDDAGCAGAQTRLFHAAQVAEIRDRESQLVGWECPSCSNIFRAASPLRFQDDYSAWQCSGCGVLISRTDPETMPSVLYAQDIHVYMGISPHALMHRHLGKARPRLLPNFVARANWLFDRLVEEVRDEVSSVACQTEHLRFTEGYPLVTHIYAPHMELGERTQLEAELGGAEVRCLCWHA